MVISLLPTCFKRTLVIKFHHSTYQTPEMRKFCLTQILDLYIKKRDLTNLFDVSQCSIVFYFVCVYRACFTHLFFRQIELQSMFMVLWSIVPLWIIKKIMHAYIVILSGSILNVSTVYLNDIWHLIGRYLSKPVLGGHPVLSGHYSIPRESVRLIQVSL